MVEIYNWGPMARRYDFRSEVAKDLARWLRIDSERIGWRLQMLTSSNGRLTLEFERIEDLRRARLTCSARKFYAMYDQPVDCLESEAWEAVELYDLIQETLVPIFRGTSLVEVQLL